MKSTTSTALFALTTLLSQALASDCGADKPWTLSILKGAGLKYFATGTAGGIDETLNDSTDICLPPGSVTVSVGANSGSSGALNTLIECNFLSGGQMSFCDISMVQGYSVSVTCEVDGGLKWLNDGGADGNKTLGYAENLFDHNQCSNYDDKNMLCINDNGPQVTSSAADLKDASFFTPAEQGGSLTFQSSKNAYPFISQDPTAVKCTIAHMGKSKVQHKRDVEVLSEGESLAVRSEGRAHAHAKSHMNRRATHLRPHPRSLLDVAGK